MTEQITVEFNVEDNGSDELVKVNSELNKTKQAGADAEDSTRRLAGSQTELRSTVMNVVDVFMKLKGAYDEIVGSTVDLANNVRQFRDVTGQSAEESSRLVQVLDDYKVGVSAAEMATKKLSKEGLEFNIQTLAKLSDEYLALNDNAARTQFLYDKFGKSGTDFAEIMLQGSDAILAANDAISENLILTDKALKQARDYEKNLDNLNDTFTALKVSMGTELLPVANDFLQVMQKQADEGFEWQDAIAPLALIENLQKLRDAQKDNTTAAQEADAARWNGLAALYKTNEALIDGAEAAEDNTEANKEFLSVLGNIQSQTKSYGEKYEKINKDMSLSDEERKRQLKELADEHEQANHRIILGLLERKLTQDGILDDRELEFLLEKGQAWGIYSDTVVSETRRAIAEVNLLASSLGSLPTQGSFTYYFNTVGAEAVVQSQSYRGGNQRSRRQAVGGSVLENRPYIVGEAGMELFVPNTSGQIIPNQRLGNNNADIVNAINANRIDERRLARSIVTAMAQAGA